MTPAGRVSVRVWLERCLLGAFLAGSLVTVLLVARNRLVPEQHPLSFGLVFWMAFVVSYAALALVLGSALWWASCWWRQALVLRAILGLGAAGGLTLLLMANHRALRQLVRLGNPPRFQVLLPVAAALAVAGIATLALLAWRRAWPLRCVSGLTLAAILAALWPATPAALPATPILDASRVGPGPPLLVFGIDGADWRHIETLLARGELPHLAALRRSGAWGPLRTLKPCLSPAVWTTMATGRLPEEHGIQGFTRARLRGVDETLPHLLPVKRAGFSRLSALLVKTGIRFEGTNTSRDRRVPAYWNIATLARSPVAVVGWYATFPAEPVRGYLVSSRFFELADRLSPASRHQQTLTRPPALFGWALPRIYRRGDVTLAEIREFIPDATPSEVEALRTERTLGDVGYELSHALCEHETKRRVSLALLERGRAERGGPLDLLVIFRGVDWVSHAALRYSDLVSEHLGATPDQTRRFGAIVSAMYRRLDRTLGEIQEVMGAANVVVLSDHGFDLERNGGRLLYSHIDTGPDGIFLASGPAFASGSVQGLSVEDVLPILLRARGLPMTPDLVERTDERVFRPGFLSATPVWQVERYGAWRTAADGTQSEGDEEAVIEHLRALGYVN
jgi:hypothetical protein